MDLRNYVNNEVLSDIQFIVEGIPIHAHKVKLLRFVCFRLCFIVWCIDPTAAKNYTNL